MVNLVTLIVFVLGIPVVFISLVGQIHLGLLFLVPILPLQNVIEKFHQFPYGNDFVDIILIAMMFGWAFSAVSKNKRIIEHSPFNKIIFIMVVYTYFSLWRGSSFLGLPAPLSAADPRLQNWKNYMLFPLLFLITFNNIRTLKQIKWLIVAMVFSMFIMDYYTGNQIKWMPSLVSREKIEGTFVWTGVNAVAAFYASYTFVLLGIIIFDRAKIRRFLFMLAILFNTYCVLFLYSRGAYAAILAGLLFICLFHKKVFLIPLLLLLFYWQTILPPKVVERINQTKTEEGTLDSSAQNRLDMWKLSLDYFKKNSVIGVGFNTIPYLGLPLEDTHNIYIKVLTEQGSIGIVILLLLFFIAIKNSWKLYKSAQNGFLKGLGLGFTTCIIATIVTNLFGDRWTYLQLSAYFWVFLGLVVRGNLIVQEQQSGNRIYFKKRVNPL